MALLRGRAARPDDAASVERREALDDWGRGITDRVTQQIIHFRDLRGISNDQLRARLGALGWDLTRFALSGLLAGSRKRKVFPVHEILLFAQALNVPPGELVAGATNRDPFKVYPEAEELVNPVEAILWIAGQSEARGVGFFDDEVVDDFYEVADLPQMVAEVKTAAQRVLTLERLRRSGLLAATGELVDAVVDAQEAYTLTASRWPDATMPDLGLPREVMEAGLERAMNAVSEMELGGLDGEAADTD